MRPHFVLALLFLTGTTTLEASIFGNGRGTRAIGMGSAFVALADDAWATYHNPAGLGRIDHAVASAFFVPQQYGLNELRTIAFGGAVPLSFGTVGLNVQQFGFELYKETGLSIGFAREIDWDIKAGVTLHVNRFAMERYGSATRGLVDVGLLAQTTKNLTFGFAARNVTGTTVGATKEPLPRGFFVGGAFAPTNAFTIAAEIEKDIRYPVSLKAGIEQRFLEIISVRAGTSSNPSTFSAGMGVNYSIFEFGYAGYHHGDLGWTHQVEMTIRLGK